MEILKQAQECSKTILQKDPFLMLEENIGIKEQIDKLFAQKLEL